MYFNCNFIQLIRDYTDELIFNITNAKLIIMNKRKINCAVITVDEVFTYTA